MSRTDRFKLRAVLLLILVGLFVWPGYWRYRYEKLPTSGWGSEVHLLHLERLDLLTGWIENYDDSYGLWSGPLGIGGTLIADALLCFILLVVTGYIMRFGLLLTERLKPRDQ